MIDLIDAKGLGCAQPFLLARQAIELHDKAVIVVDTRESLESIRALATYTGSSMEIAEESGNIYRITLKRKQDAAACVRGAEKDGIKRNDES